MPGPWEKYQQQAGPWSKFQAPAPAPELTPADKAFKAVEDTGSAVLEHPNVKGAIGWVGDKFERFMDAPVRAWVGSLQKGDNVYRAAGKGIEQFGEKPFQETPTAKEMMARTGLSTTPLSEVAPNLFSDTGEGVRLRRGGVLDVSPAGVAGGLTQPSTWAIPAEATLAATSKVAGAGAKVAGKAAEVASPLIEAAGKTGELGKKAVFKTGEVLTGGNLDAQKALAASERLKGYEMLVPEAAKGKAGKAVGAAREAIGESVVAPGSRQALEKVKDVLTKAESRALRTPQSQAVLEKIDTLLATGDDVPLQTVDDLVRNLDDVGWTQQGNKRSLHPMWGQPVAESRRILNDLLPATPEGAKLQGAKTRFSDLSTAQGQQGSKLRGIMSFSGLPSGVGLGVAMGEPLVAAAATAASRVIAPRTYFQIVGAAKLPKDAVEALVASYQSGKVGAIKDTLAGLAQKYPREIAKVSQALAAQGSEAVSFANERENAIKRRLRRVAE